MLTSTYNLSLRPGVKPLVVHVSQYDKGETLVFNLTHTGTSADISSGITAEIRGTKPDGNGFSYGSPTVSYSYSNNLGVVTVTLTEQMTSVSGNVPCEIILLKGSGSNEKQLGTANFILCVERAALDKDTVVSASEIRQLVNVIDRTDELIAAANRAQSAASSVESLIESLNSTAQEVIDAKEETLEVAASIENAKNAALIELDVAKDTNIGDIDTAKTSAIGALNAVLEHSEEEIDETKQEAIDMIVGALQAILDVNSRAEGYALDAVSRANSAIVVAAQALEKSSNVENESVEVAAAVDELKQAVDDIVNKLSLKFDDVYLLDGYEYFESEGVLLKGPIGPFAGGGGGGGGSGNNAEFDAKNTSGWLTKTISSGGDCPIEITWSSIEEEIPTGDGVATISVGGTTRTSFSVSQGAVTIDLAPYCSVGTNRIQVRVADIYNNSRVFTFTISVVELSLASSFDPTITYNAPISFPYIPTGSVYKTVYFVMDGTTIGTYSTSGTGRQLSFTIPAQSHGAHEFTVYFEATINYETVRSNTLRYEIMFTETGNSTPIVTSTFRQTTVEQYTPLHIDYIVYNPDSLVSDVTISVNGSPVSVLTGIDRTSHTFDYRPNDTGTVTIDITCGETTKTFSLTVTESSIDVEAETDQLALYLSSAGRSNDESPSDRETWTYNDISADFTDFNWSSDGWQRDNDGAPVMRLSGDARIEIPYKIFQTDARSTGKTIEIDFATSVVMDYSTSILSCMSGGRGIKITPQTVSLSSEQSEISTQFKEDEHVRISFVIEKSTENRLVYCYINGVISGVIRYPVDDDFSQQIPVNITMGSNYAVMDVYSIRVYENDLTRYQVLDNWIADSTTIDDMVDRYTRNSIYNEYNAVTIANLPNDTPYMVLQSSDLPQYKGDKKNVSGYFVNPSNTAKNFSFENAQFDVQGTSSQYYYVKNYKGKFKNGFVLPNSSVISKYQFIDERLPINIFCFKADVASSEGANNVILARLYNEVCPYRTPGQIDDERVSQGIDGFPMVIFQDDGESTRFVGKYNFNADKGAEEFFGFQEDDESWETLNNTSNRVIWKSADYSGSDWQNDFEARYPDLDPAYTNSSQLQEFAEWIVQTDRTASTNDALDEPVTYDSGEVDQNSEPILVTYTHDTAEYRLAKFRNEIGDYVEMQSSEFYYLFTELFLMVDSRAKNSFPSFMGSSLD